MDSLLGITNIIVMGILTFMVFWATRSSAQAAEKSSKAAEASSELSRQIFEFQQNQLRVATEIRRNNIVYLMEQVLNAIDLTQGDLFNVYDYKKSPLNHDLSSDELATHFKMEDANLIIDFWRKYREYIDKYWKTSTGHWRDPDIDWGDTTKLANESIRLHEELMEIKKKFEAKYPWNN